MSGDICSHCIHQCMEVIDLAAIVFDFHGIIFWDAFYRTRAVCNVCVHDFFKKFFSSAACRMQFIQHSCSPPNNVFIFVGGQPYQLFPSIQPPCSSVHIELIQHILQINPDGIMFFAVRIIRGLELLTVSQKRRQVLQDIYSVLPHPIMLTHVSVTVPTTGRLSTAQIIFSVPSLIFRSS